MQVNDNKILFITTANIYGKNGHANMVRMHYKILCEAYPNRVCLLSVNNSTNEIGSDYRNVTALGKMYSVIHFYPVCISERFVKKIFWMIEVHHIAIIYFDSSILGKIIKQIKMRFPRIKLITYFPDIQRQRLAQLSKKGLKCRIADSLCIYNERKAAEFSDSIFVLNKRDCNLLKAFYDSIADGIVPIIVPDQKLPQSKKCKKAGELNLLFVGVDYIPNVDGINWYIKEVLPYVNDAVKLTIVGYQMEKYKENWEKNHNIIVKGTVEETKNYYYEADAVIAPIFEGGGMKVKTAEALSYGKRLIGLPEALEGYWENVPTNMRGKKIFCCKNAADFINAVNQLCSEKFDKSDESIARWESGLYSFTAAFGALKGIFDKYINEV